LKKATNGSLFFCLSSGELLVQNRELFIGIEREARVFTMKKAW